MVYKWANIPSEAVILRAEGTKMLVRKLGEGMTRLVYLPFPDSEVVYKVELKFRRDGTPDTLINQPEVDIMNQVPSQWRLGFRKFVEDIKIVNKWDVPHSATIMVVERFERGLMAEVQHHLEHNTYPELAHIMRMAINLSLIHI